MQIQTLTKVLTLTHTMSFIIIIIIIIIVPTHSIEINVDDGIFYNYGKDLDKPNRYKGTELCVMRVVN